MDLEVLAGLIPEENRPEATEYVKGLVEAEKQVGIAKYRTKDQEVMKLKGRFNDIGYDKTKFDTFDSFKESLTKSTPAGTVDELNQRVKVLGEKYDAEVRYRTEAETKATNLDITGKLTALLKDELYGASALVENAILRGDLANVDGVITSKSGLSIEEYAKLIIEDNKEDVKVKRTSGVNERLVTQPPKGKESFTQMLQAEQARKQKLQ